MPHSPATWKRRARILHGICQGIASSRKRGRMAAYRSGAAQWNRSALSREMARPLTASGIRACFAAWKVNPGSAVFMRGPTRPARAKISPEQAAQYARICLRDGLSPVQLYRQLHAMNGYLGYSLATFRRALPVQELARVRRAEKMLQAAEREVALAARQRQKKFQ